MSLRMNPWTQILAHGWSVFFTMIPVVFQHLLFFGGVDQQMSNKEFTNYNGPNFSEKIWHWKLKLSDKKLPKKVRPYLNFGPTNDAPSHSRRRNLHIPNWQQGKSVLLVQVVGLLDLLYVYYIYTYICIHTYIKLFIHIEIYVNIFSNAYHTWLYVYKYIYI